MYGSAQRVTRKGRDESDRRYNKRWQNLVNHFVTPVTVQGRLPQVSHGDLGSWVVRG